MVPLFSKVPVISRPVVEAIINLPVRLVVNDAEDEILMLLQVIVVESIRMFFPAPIIISSVMFGIPAGDQTAEEFQFPDTIAVFVEAKLEIAINKVNDSADRNFIVPPDYYWLSQFHRYFYL